MNGMHAVTIRLEPESGEAVEHTAFIPTHLRSVDEVAQDFRADGLGSRRFTVRVRFEPGLLLQGGE